MPSYSTRVAAAGKFCSKLDGASTKSACLRPVSAQGSKACPTPTSSTCPKSGPIRFRRRRLCARSRMDCQHYLTPVASAPNSNDGPLGDIMASSIEDFAAEEHEEGRPIRTGPASNRACLVGKRLRATPSLNLDDHLAKGGAGLKSHETFESAHDSSTWSRSTRIMAGVHRACRIGDQNCWIF